MSWLVLVVSGLFEAVWATALHASHGLTKPWPSLIFVVAVLVSMGGLSFAMRDIGTGTAYSVWVGVGAAATVVYGMATGAESVSVAKCLLLVGLVACIVGLKLAS